MPQAIGQLTYSVFNPQASPGALGDFKYNSFDSFVANESINPGRAVEMAADGLSIEQVQKTTTTLPIIGFSMLKRAREGGGAVGVNAYGIGSVVFAQGEVVAVLQSGRIFAEWDPTSTQQAFARPNIMHSSTIATSRGIVTFTATSAGAGVEITQAPACVQTRQALPNTGNIVLIDVDLPGA